MRIEVLCTGDELLTGLTADTNSPFFMERVVLLGAQVSYEQIVGDVMEDIVEALKGAASRAEVVLVSGGLGPTMDDLTAEAAARAAGVQLVEHAETWASIQERFKKRGIQLSPNNRRQALVPEGSEVVKNPAGSAPMFIVRIGQCRLFFVPGVPREYKALVESEVLPRIDALLNSEPGRTFRAARLVKTMLLPESHMDERVRPLFTAHPHVRFGTRTKAPENHLKLFAEGATEDEAQERLAAAERASRSVLGPDVFGADDERYADVLIRELRAARKTVAVAESCTGGLVQQWLTSAAGSSAAFKSGVVPYSEALKTEWVGVPAELIRAHGVVSAEVARSLAEKIRVKAGADYGLGVTGYAGPGGGNERDPVGTVYVALARDAETVVERVVQLGDRERIRLFAAGHALELLRHEVRRALEVELRFIAPKGPLYREELDLRYRILREPLGHTRESVVFPFDRESLHLLALRGDRLVGCVLFHPESDKDGRLFQMAVETSEQKSGVGAKLVRALETELIRRGFRSVHLHARANVCGFYERLGYEVYGEEFVEVGIPHRHMRKTLASGRRPLLRGTALGGDLAKKKGKKPEEAAAPAPAATEPAAAEPPSAPAASSSTPPAAAGQPHPLIAGLRIWFTAYRVEVILFAISFVVLTGFSGQRFLRQSAAPHFVYQAKAWLEGHEDVDPMVLPNIEDWACVRDMNGQKVRCEGRPLQTDKWYVSFPWFPSVVMMPFVAINGYQLNDTSFGVIIGALAVALFYSLLRYLSKNGESPRDERDNTIIALLLAFGTLFFYCAIRGEVWFSAEVMGVALTCLYARNAVKAHRPVLAGLFFSMATLTRTPLLFTGVFFLVEALAPNAGNRLQQLKASLKDREKLKAVGYFAAGAAPLALIAAVFNYVRFGKLSEFGHAFLFNNRVNQDIDTYGLFNVHYLARNLKAAFFMLPDVSFNPLKLGYDPNGLSLLLTLPLLVLLVIPKDKPRLHWPLWVTVAVTALPGLLYQNNGYMQFGFRFSLDYTPYLLLLFAVGAWSLRNKWVVALATVGLLVNFWGAVAFRGYTEYVRNW